jgi:hypothetical protein
VSIFLQCKQHSVYSGYGFMFSSSKLHHAFLVFAKIWKDMSTIILLFGKQQHKLKFMEKNDKLILVCVFGDIQRCCSEANSFTEPNKCKFQICWVCEICVTSYNTNSINKIKNFPKKKYVENVKSEKNDISLAENWRWQCCRNWWFGSFTWL